MVTNSDLLKKLQTGEIRFHQLDTLIGEEKATKLRAEFIEKKLGIKLYNIRSSILAPKKCKANIENMIGSVQVPLGIAGPVKVNGEYASGEYYLPLATSEGALVASVNRGCTVINKAGGAEAVILKNEQTRSILFKTRSITESKKLKEWIQEKFNDLKSAGEDEEPFIEITGIDTYVVGLNVWLRIRAYTYDAMGMNMITIAGKRIGKYIEDKLEIEFISETGNLCTDKKPSERVCASINIPEDVIKEVLKTTADKLIDMNYRKNLLGSAASASLGFNAHFANIIAAMFIATGQDAAHVVDGSLGFTTVEKSDKGVNFTITLPDLQVGTIGGGTGISTQKECLQILGVAGPSKDGSNSKRLAEIVATAVLAGEISLLGALCTKELAKAHKNLNR